VSRVHDANEGSLAGPIKFTNSDGKRERQTCGRTWPVYVNNWQTHVYEQLPLHNLSNTRSTMDIRVQDYLDDKLQSAADLDSLDSLLENVKEQQLLLKQQVSDDADSLAAMETHHS
jgi:hypothetical protein